LVIRPLAYVAEKDIVRWSDHRQFPIIPCTLCGSQENLQRKQVGDMMRAWDKQYPGRLDNMANALQHIVPSHLMDRQVFDFAGLMADGVPVPEGDLAFDTPSISSSFPIPLTVE
ncbi:MAG: tRNA 2-thiocytidine biosynthesis protein TtcA, partial [Pseudomonadota bacterium]